MNKISDIGHECVFDFSLIFDKRKKREFIKEWREKQKKGEIDHGLLKSNRDFRQKIFFVYCLFNRSSKQFIKY